MLDVSSEILVPLCKEVTLEKTMRPMMAGIKMAGIKFSKIRLGTLDTWHGTPDMRVRGGVHLVHQKVEEGEDTLAITAVDSDYESVSSDGMTTTIEDSTLPQVVATCVVSSFTESSLHPDKPALVPTILIDEERFRVCLYDCKKDVLLISNAKSLSTKGGLSQSGMTLLWVVLNYRLFLQELPDHVSKYPAGVKSRLKACRHLHHFNSLKDKDTNWDMEDQDISVEDSHLPLVFIDNTPPSKKKRKL